MMYETILNNPKYKEVVNTIEKMKFITNGKWDWEHGLGHYKRVANYVETILKQLNENERTIELGKCAALLHDIGLSKSGTKKIDHALISSQMFRDYLENTHITKEEEKILEEAIKDHSNGNNIKTNLGLALLLADKLDVTYHRTINSSIQDEVNKEFQKIKKVDIKITKKELILNYNVEEELNLKNILEWQKSITIPEKVAKYLNKEFIFMINNELTIIKSQTSKKQNIEK